MSIPSYWKEFIYDVEDNVYTNSDLLLFETDLINTEVLKDIEVVDKIDNVEGNSKDFIFCFDHFFGLSNQGKEELLRSSLGILRENGTLTLHTKGNMVNNTTLLSSIRRIGFSDTTYTEYHTQDDTDLVLRTRKAKRDIVFIITHHSGTEFYTQLLRRCIESILKYVEGCRIIVSKTSSSVIPGDMVYENVTYENVGKDGTAVYGAIEKLLGKGYPDNTNFVIFQDSMYMVKSLPESIWDKNIFTFWNFTPDRDHTDIIQCYFNRIEPKITEFYKSNNWNGVFGPAFGGIISTLKKMWDILSNILSWYDEFPVRENIMASERIMGVTSSYLGYSVSTTEGSILDYTRGRTYYFHRSMSMEEADGKMRNDQTGHVRKVWVGRN